MDFIDFFEKNLIIKNKPLKTNKTPINMIVFSRDNLDKSHKITVDDSNGIIYPPGTLNPSVVFFNFEAFSLMVASDIPR